MYENESSKSKQKHLRSNDDNIILLLNFFMNITFKKLQNIVRSQCQSLKITVIVQLSFFLPDNKMHRQHGGSVFPREKRLRIKINNQAAILPS